MSHDDDDDDDVSLMSYFWTLSLAFAKCRSTRSHKHVCYTKIQRVAFHQHDRQPSDTEQCHSMPLCRGCLKISPVSGYLKGISFEQSLQNGLELCCLVSVVP